MEIKEKVFFILLISAAALFPQDEIRAAELDHSDSFIAGIIMLHECERFLTDAQKRFFLHSLLDISQLDMDEALHILESYRNDPRGWKNKLDHILEEIEET
ncbi:MAG: hypothetical protein ACQEQ4_00060 [Fibrobacterota bacterium]